jgi:Tfp pilus assembly protein PilX
MHRLSTAAPDPARDEGAVLVLTLVLTVILGAVACALAAYAVVGLRTSGVTDRRLDRLAATDAGLRAMAETVKQNPANCKGAASPITFTLDSDRTTVTAWCERSGADTSQWTPFRLHAKANRSGVTAVAIADVQGRTSSYGPCVAGQRCILSINSWAMAE